MPFYDILRDVAVVFAVVVGNQKPQIPADVEIPEDLTHLWHQCWLKQPDERPDAQSLTIMIHKIIEKSKPEGANHIPCYFDALTHVSLNSRSYRTF